MDRQRSGEREALVVILEPEVVPGRRNIAPDRESGWNRPGASLDLPAWGSSRQRARTDGHQRIDQNLMKMAHERC